MLGLFDSGCGGLNTVRCLKKTNDDLDLVYLIDRENAPYGIKSEKEILEITKNNIKTLTGMGAERVLIACCTASTVHRLLPPEQKSVSIPIIEVVADEAKRLTRSGRIGVIATERTVSSHAFGNALYPLFTFELALTKLVTDVDSGICDKNVTEDYERELERMLTPVFTADIDTLILGCTHFPAIIGVIDRISKKYGDIKLVDSAAVGATTLRKYKMKTSDARLRDKGDQNGKIQTRQNKRRGG